MLGAPVALIIIMKFGAQDIYKTKCLGFRHAFRLSKLNAEAENGQFSRGNPLKGHGFSAKTLEHLRFSMFNELIGILYVSVVFVQTLGTNMSILPDVPGMLNSSLSWTTYMIYYTPNMTSR